MENACRPAADHLSASNRRLAGIGDYTCPPTGVAAFYNNLTCPKLIRWVQGATHGYRPPKAQIIEKSGN
jgi:cephalosporin-C deacetylase-like acetyl esterase